MKSADNRGIIQKKKTVSRAVFGRKGYRSENRCFEMVAMATSCAIFLRKNDSFIANMQKRKRLGAVRWTYDLRSTKFFVHGSGEGLKGPLGGTGLKQDQGLTDYVLMSQHA